MKQLKLEIDELLSQVAGATDKLSIAELDRQRAVIKQEMSGSHFWDNNEVAANKSKQYARLDQQVSPWQKLHLSLNELAELAATEDSSLQDEITKQLLENQKLFDELKQQLMFQGKYDTYDVILSIYAGAGGTDAQDWAEMLLRMYTRWAQQHKFDALLFSHSAGDEAGIKSASLEISGSFMYGRLRGENGVHRLVRQSPFNSDNLRQTSFAMVEVMPKVAEPKAIELNEKDLRIDVYRSGGRGGQSVNTTDSAVRVTHLPTGITVSIQNEKSQIQNKETALTILRSRLLQLKLEQHVEKIEEIKGGSTSAEWGNQIRNYVLHPYKQVKDVRTKHEAKDPDRVLDGDIDDFIKAYLEHTLGQ